MQNIVPKLEKYRCKIFRKQNQRLIGNPSRIHPRMMQNPSEIGPKSIKNRSKIEKNRSRDRFAGRSASRRVPERLRDEQLGLFKDFLRENGAPRVDLVAFGKMPLRVQGKLGFREEFLCRRCPRLSTGASRCVARARGGLRGYLPTECRILNPKLNPKSPNWSPEGVRNGQNGTKRGPIRA